MYLRHRFVQGKKYYSIVESYKVPGRKNPKQRELLYIGRLEPEKAEEIRLILSLVPRAIQGEKVFTSKEFGLGQARFHGAHYLLWKLWNELEIPRLFAEHHEGECGMSVPCQKVIFLLAVNVLFLEPFVNAAK